MKFAIIGSGNIARTYALAVQRIPHAETVAIVSRSARKLPDFSHIPSFESLASIEPDYDAVIICTPNGLHHISAIEAAERGKHVLCEKPIDISLSAIDRMIDTCHQHKVKLAVAYQRRYSSDNPLVKRLIEENKLGKIFSVNLSVLNYRDDAYYNSAPYRGTFDIDGGGPFIQQASHYIDLYCWLFGKPTKLISKLGTFIHDIEVEDHGAALCTHDSGIIGTITASTATKPGFPAKLEIYTDKGFLIMENDIITTWDIAHLSQPNIQTSAPQTHTGAASAQVNDTSNHEFIIEDFIQAIESDTTPLISGESARIATEVILDIYQQQL